MKSKIEIVKGLVLQILHFLEEEYYYTPVVNVLNSDVFIESLEVVYVNEIHRRKITISYTAGQIIGEIKYTFSASIIRIPYSGWNDFYSLSNYLQSIGKDFSGNLVNNFDLEEAEIILNSIKNALCNHSLSIIKGDVWLENYYPRKD